MSRRSSLIVGIAIVVAVLVAGVAWIAVERDGGVRLLAQVDPMAESLDSPHSAHVSFDLFPICLSQPGEVTITGVEPIERRGDVSITDFSTTTYDRVGTKPSTEHGRIRDLPYLQGPRTVTADCLEGAPNDTELVVEIHVPDPQGHGFVEGLRIHYLDGTDEKVTEVPMTIGTCRMAGGCAADDLRVPDLASS